MNGSYFTCFYFKVPVMIFTHSHFYPQKCAQVIFLFSKLHQNICVFSAANTTQLHIFYSLLFAHFASVSFGHNASCFRRASHCLLRIFCLTEASVFTLRTLCPVDEGLTYSYSIQLICILVLFFLSKDRQQASKCDFKPALLLCLAVFGYIVLRFIGYTEPPSVVSSNIAEFSWKYPPKMKRS